MIAKLVKGIAVHLLAIVAIGAILVPSSELWFYPVEFHAGLWVLFAAYGLIGWLCVSLAVFRDGVSSLIIGGALFGLLIEGVVVQELFTGLPITIFWTSLSWHMVLSVWVGLWLYRKGLQARSIRPALLLCGSYGAFLGLWAAYMWSAESGLPVGDLAFPQYLPQLLGGYLSFLTGHLLWDRIAPHFSPQGIRKSQIVLAVVTTTVLVIGSLVIAFPISLVLPALVAPLLWVLYHLPSSPSVVLCKRFSPYRHAPSLLIPASAAVSYEVFRHPTLQFETNVVALSVLSVIAIWLLGRAVRDSVIAKRAQ